MVLDLPEEKGGSDKGATALELTLMSLSGCISTIFSKIAGNSDVAFESLKVHVEGSVPDKAKTITGVKATVYVNSDESEEKLQKILDKTMAACPVGILFEQADVSMESTLVKE